MMSPELPKVFPDMYCLDFISRIYSSLTNVSNDLGRERYRKAMLTSLMNVFSQFVQLATGLISVPLTLNYIGVERFGLWMTLSTGLTFITFSDFGVGIGTQDRISRHVGVNDFYFARKTFFSSFSFVILLFALLMALSQMLVPEMNLAKLFSLKSVEAIEEIVPTTQMVVFVLCLGLISGVVQRAFNALQEGFFVALVQVITRIVSLILLFVVVDLKMGLPVLVFVIGGLSSVGLLLIGLPLLLYRHKWMRPLGNSIADYIDVTCVKDVLKVGVFGLGASLAIYFVNNSIMVLISGKYGAENVADYAVLLKLISIPALLLSYLLLPLWPAITEAKVKNDTAWIKSLYRKCSLLTVTLTAVFVAFFLIFGRQIILIWTQNADIVPSFRLLLANVVFMVLGFWNALLSVTLNGLSMYKGQATYGAILAVLFVFLASLVPSSYEKDIIVWVVGIGYFMRCVLMQLEVYKCLNFSRHNNNCIHF